MKLLFRFYKATRPCLCFLREMKYLYKLYCGPGSRDGGSLVMLVTNKHNLIIMR